jgi:4-amino-4-deoxy-L-arabinose transferase-like glycosyltransferase
MNGTPHHTTGWTAKCLEWADKSHVLAVLMVLVMGIVMFAPGIATLQPMDRDEPRFAQASKQMMESGDYVDIRFQDEARHKKPVGIYWLQVASVELGSWAGISEARSQIWLYRLPSLLGALLTLLGTYAAGLAFLSRRAAFMAAILTGSTILLGVEARLAKTDAVLTATIVWAFAVMLHAFQQWRRDDRINPTDHEMPFGFVLCFWSVLALSLLVKGPILPILMALALAVVWLLQRDLGWFKTITPFWGPILTLLLVLPWFVAIMMKSGGEFFSASVGQDMMSKVAGAQERHGGPPGTYLLVFFGTAWPLAPLFCLSVPFIWRHKRDAVVLFLLGWIVPFWIILELVPTKLPHYVLPLYPAMALLVCLAAERGMISVAGWGVKLAMAGLVLPVVVLLVGLTGGSLWLGDQLPVMALLVLLLALWPVIEAARALHKGLIAQTGLLAYAGMVLVSVAVYMAGSPVLQSIRISDRLAQAMEKPECGDKHLAMLGYSEPSLVFLTRTDLLFLPAQAMVSFLQQPGCRIAGVTGNQMRDFEAARLAAGLDLVPVEVVKGFNINGGKRLEVSIFARRDNHALEQKPEASKP